MQIGLVGMAGAGKTTFYNLLTGENRPTGLQSGAPEVYTASALVPDYRVDFLSELYRPRKTTAARIQFSDLPGIEASAGSAGPATRLLEEVRGVDALVQVVRAFKDQFGREGRPHHELIELQTELLLADLAMVEKRIERLHAARKIPNDARLQLEVLERLKETLENEEQISGLKLTAEERAAIAGLQFLTDRPLIIAVNVDEDQLRGGTGAYPGQQQLEAYAQKNKMVKLEVCAQIEMEISRLALDERAEFMQDLGLEEPGIARLARAAYNALQLESFFTVGRDEVRAWTVRSGTTARKAAGKVHSDMERGFIRAEVFHFDDLYRLGSAARVKESGLLRLEGRDYIVKDGDIINFRFNV